MGQNLKLECVASAILAVSLFAFNLEAQIGKIQETVPEPNWQLATDDTHMTIAVADNRPAIYELTNPAQGWNWTPVHAEFPLLGRVIVGKSQTPTIPDWTYQDAAEDETDGRKITLRFTSTAPKLELKSIWWARKGPGPVEQWMTVQNQTGEDLMLHGLDMVSADISVVANSAVTLWRFNKTPRAVGPRTTVTVPGPVWGRTASRCPRCGWRTFVMGWRILPTSACLNRPSPESTLRPRCGPREPTGSSVPVHFSWFRLKC